MEKVIIILLLEKNMLGNGKKIKNGVKVFYIILQELSIKENGKRIKYMVKA